MVDHRAIWVIGYSVAEMKKCINHWRCGAWSRARTLAVFWRENFVFFWRHLKTRIKLADISVKYGAPFVYPNLCNVFCIFNEIVILIKYTKIFMQKIVKKLSSKQTVAKNK